MSKGAVAAFISLLAHAVLAQGPSGTFTGVVTRDTLGHSVRDAEVSLPALARTTRSDSAGYFQFHDVPAGRHYVVVRAIGFEILLDSIDIQSGHTLDADLTLTRAPTALDTIHTVGAMRTPTPWMLREFESRRRSSASGKFLTDSALRTRDDDMLVSVVGLFPGTHTVQVKSYVYIASGRTSGSGKPAFRDVGGANCFVTVYLDGSEIYPAGGLVEPPDFGRMRVSDYSAVEYYNSPSQAPAQYSRTGTACGVMLLWSRQRP